MTHLDLFSGIGGFALAGKWVWGVEHKVLAFCEIDKFCHQVLNKHWPDVPIIEDIHSLRGGEYEAVDIISGGFPCQPFSSINTRGKRGKEHEAYLWPEMLRIISEANPTWVISENVLRFKNMGMREVRNDLENIGYDTAPFIIPACGVGSPQLRERIFILAHTEGKRKSRTLEASKGEAKENERCRRQENWGFVRANPTSTDCRWRGEWPRYTGVCRVASGLPSKLDKNRVKALGNAIVPQVAAELMQFIKKIENGR